MRLALLVVVLAGCGRIGFDALTGGDDGTHRDASGGGGDGNGSSSADAFAGMGAPALVQVKEAAGNATSTLDVTLSQPLATGDFIFISVGTHDGTSNVATVVDSAANSFTGSTMMLRGNAMVSQQLWNGFASGNVSGDTITIAFGGNPTNASARVLVYRGVSMNTVGSYGGSGTGGATAVGMAACAPNDVVVVSETATQTATGPGTGFTTRMMTTYGDIVSDRVCATSGLMNVSVPLAGTSSYVMETMTIPHL